MHHAMNDMQWRWTTALLTLVLDAGELASHSVTLHSQ